MAQIDIDKFVISLRRCFGEDKGIATTLDRCLFSQGLKYVDTPTGGRLERVDQPTMLENQSNNPKSLKERIGCEADCTIKQEWSEYDEKMLLELSQCCDLNKTQVQWLLSLKDRVQPQPEQGWSEENERIKKWLICLLNEMQYHHCDDDREMGNKALAWLEKQGEQKGTLCDTCRKAQPSHSCQDITALGRCVLEKQGELKPTELPKVKSVPLSFKEKLGIFMQYTSVDLEKEENQQLLDEAAKELLQLAYSDKANEIALASAKTWEESMAILMAANNAYRRGQKEYKPAEWSEEDEQLYNDLSDTYYYNDEDYPEETYKLMLKRVLDWMNKRAKSLRPLLQWKPSDEQVVALEKILKYFRMLNAFGETIDELKELEEQLKKLREE